MKTILKKSLLIAPWVILIILGVYFSSQAIANWHYKTFSQPFVQASFLE